MTIINPNSTVRYEKKIIDNLVKMTKTIKVNKKDSKAVGKIFNKCLLSFENIIKFDFRNRMVKDLKKRLNNLQYKYESGIIVKLPESFLKKVNSINTFDELKALLDTAMRFTPVSSRSRNSALETSGSSDDDFEGNDEIDPLLIPSLNTCLQKMREESLFVVKRKKGDIPLFPFQGQECVTRLMEVVKEAKMPLEVISAKEQMTALKKHENLEHESDYPTDLTVYEYFVMINGSREELQKITPKGNGVGRYFLTEKSKTFIFVPAETPDYKKLYQLFGTVIAGNKTNEKQLRMNIAKFRWHWLRQAPLQRKNRDVANLFEIFFLRFHNLSQPKIKNGVDLNFEALFTPDQKQFEKNYFANFEHRIERSRSSKPVRSRRKLTRRSHSV